MAQQRTDRPHMDIVTFRLSCPRGRLSENCVQVHDWREGTADSLLAILVASASELLCILFTRQLAVFFPPLLYCLSMKYIYISWYILIRDALRKYILCVWSIDLYVGGNWVDSLSFIKPLPGLLDFFHNLLLWNFKEYLRYTAITKILIYAVLYNPFKHIALLSGHKLGLPLCPAASLFLFYTVQHSTTQCKTL